MSLLQFLGASTQRPASAPPQCNSTAFFAGSNIALDLGTALSATAGEVPSRVSPGKPQALRGADFASVDVSSHAAYFRFYSANKHLNPRLPPPLLNQSDLAWESVDKGLDVIAHWQNPTSGVPAPSSPLPAQPRPQSALSAIRTVTHDGLDHLPGVSWTARAGSAAPQLDILLQTYSPKAHPADTTPFPAAPAPAAAAESDLKQQQPKPKAVAAVLPTELFSKAQACSNAAQQPLKTAAQPSLGGGPAVTALRPSPFSGNTMDSNAHKLQRCMPGPLGSGGPGDLQAPQPAAAAAAAAAVAISGLRRQGSGQTSSTHRASGDGRGDWLRPEEPQASRAKGDAPQPRVSGGGRGAMHYQAQVPIDAWPEAPAFRPAEWPSPPHVGIAPFLPQPPPPSSAMPCLGSGMMSPPMNSMSPSMYFQGMPASEDMAAVLNNQAAMQSSYMYMAAMYPYYYGQAMAPGMGSYPGSGYMGQPYPGFPAYPCYPVMPQGGGRFFGQAPPRPEMPGLAQRASGGYQGAPPSPVVVPGGARQFHSVPPPPGAVAPQYQAVPAGYGGPASVPGLAARAPAPGRAGASRVMLPCEWEEYRQRREPQSSVGVIPAAAMTAPAGASGGGHAGAELWGSMEGGQRGEGWGNGNGRWSLVGTNELGPGGEERSGVAGRVDAAGVVWGKPEASASAWGRPGRRSMPGEDRRGRSGRGGSVAEAEAPAVPMATALSAPAEKLPSPGSLGSAPGRTLPLPSATRFELRGSGGQVLGLCMDQHGSRLVQQQLDLAGPEDLEAVLNELLPSMLTLATDVFANYVVQKLLDRSSPEQRLSLGLGLRGSVMQLSLNMYGCRVMQKALELLPLEPRCDIVHELLEDEAQLVLCMRDQNGNHVVQKVVECLPCGRIAPLLDLVLPAAEELSRHPYGCRIVQRVLERCPADSLHRRGVMDAVIGATAALALDQYGNYVVQHVVEHGCAAERARVVGVLVPEVSALSMHKYASNVVEKCLACCSGEEREAMIRGMLGAGGGPVAGAGAGQAAAAAAAAADGVAQAAEGVAEEGQAVGETDPLQMMMKDPYGNFVVQKALEVCSDAQHALLLSRVHAHLHSIRNLMYGKHVVARVEKLLAEEPKQQEQHVHQVEEGAAAAAAAAAVVTVNAHAASGC